MSDSCESTKGLMNIPHLVKTTTLTDFDFCCTILDGVDPGCLTLVSMKFTTASLVSRC